MGNSFYNAVKLLEDKNMIRFVYEKDIKYIGINPHPESWITDSIEKIDEIIDNEINLLLGIKKNDLLSSSSSSWSSSSSSSKNNLSGMDEDMLNRALLKELDAMDP